MCQCEAVVCVWPCMDMDAVCGGLRKLNKPCCRQGSSPGSLWSTLTTHKCWISFLRRRLAHLEAHCGRSSLLSICMCLKSLWKFCCRNCTSHTHGLITHARTRLILDVYKLLTVQLLPRIIPRVISTCSSESLFLICWSLPRWLQVLIHQFNQVQRSCSNEWTEQTQLPQSAL